MDDLVELWVLRHAEARDAGLGQDDATRPLTARGRRQARRLRHALRAVAPRFDVLLHSPFARAVETADLLAPLAVETRVTLALARSPSNELLDELGGCRARKAAVVGHEPWLGELAFWLATGWTVAEPARQPAWIALEKGGALCLRGVLRQGSMRMVAQLDARAIRRLARR